ncbi:Kinase binding protein CGI-121 family protein [Theileria parva strain Muguga]|uniref:Kinase binding protein CGI-121 family protein n=1 Tax=Theileria parva strain Muguga TaxID=333668 RepID=UPI001C61B728|nr:Kinase binding protein CGI-121 family protein [Theileria parva strain Muguga]EAN33516.2 Kinase binding protein CGI-121 family protein [Theileria parva strain Muguga]
MVNKNPNYGTFINSFKFSDDLEDSTERNLDVYITLYSKIANIGPVLDYALNVNDYNKPLNSEDSFNSIKNPKSILDFNVLFLVLRPSLILSTDHLLHSVARALTNVLNSKPVSSNFTTEVAFMLSGSSSVAKSLERVLLSKSDKFSPALIVTLVQNKSKDNILDIIDGVQDDISNLDKYTKVDELIKEFKITQEELRLPGGLEASILCRIGVKRI